MQFARVVALGDSLQDTSAERGPVFSAHVAQRLGASFTNLAVGGATSASLIEMGQHTVAASEFGSGDLAVLWIGGNDFLGAIDAGDPAFVPELERNVDTILATLRNAGLEVITFNLPDMSLLPGTFDLQGEAQATVRALTEEWRERLNVLAARHGAVVVDVYGLFKELRSQPERYAVDGVAPVLAPEAGERIECPRCVWVDGVHPTSFGQALIANAAITALNARFDPAGIAPLPLLSETEKAGLIADQPYLRISGLWFDPAADGEGYNIVESVAGATVYYYGKDAMGSPLWLVSETLAGRFALNVPTTLRLFSTNGGSFDQPTERVDLVEEGTLELTFSSCTTARFSLEVSDGGKTQATTQLAQPLGAWLPCDSASGAASLGPHLTQR